MCSLCTLGKTFNSRTKDEFRVEDEGGRLDSSPTRDVKVSTRTPVTLNHLQMIATYRRPHCDVGDERENVYWYRTFLLAEQHFGSGNYLMVNSDQRARQVSKPVSMT